MKLDSMQALYLLTKSTWGTSTTQWPMLMELNDEPSVATTDAH